MGLQLTTNWAFWSSAKPKVAPKKEGIPMKKIFRKEQSQVPQSKKKSSVQVKPPAAGKRQAVLDDKNLVKLPWSVS